MDDNLHSFTDHISQGISPRGQQKSILFRIARIEFLMRGKGSLRQSPGVVHIRILSKLVTPPDRQFPQILRSSTVAVGAFDLHIDKKGPGDIAAAVHGCGGMAILTEQTAFWISFPAFALVVKVVPYKNA